MITYLTVWIKATAVSITVLTSCALASKTKINNDRLVHAYVIRKP